MCLSVCVSPQVLAVVSSQVQKDAQTVSFLAQETAEVGSQVFLTGYLVEGEQGDPLGVGGGGRDCYHRKFFGIK